MKWHLWQDMLKVVGDEVFYAYLVDNQAIVIPETIDAIRALTELNQTLKSRYLRPTKALELNRVFY